MAYQNGSWVTRPRNDAMKIMQAGDFRVTAQNGKKYLDAFFWSIFTKQIPYGKEHIMVETIKRLLGINAGDIEGVSSEVDDIGNLFIWVGTKQEDGSIKESKTIFSTHMDTVQDDKFKDDKNLHVRSILVTQENPKPGQEGYIWASVRNDKGILTDSVLGGDDKCGLYIVCRMILRRVPGLYIFHVGEERGCVGSKHVAKTRPDMLKLYDRAVAFDRKDYTDIICHQLPGRGCSEEFGKALAEALNIRMPPKVQFKSEVRGTYTDTASYFGLVPECTNVSCGYFDAHSSSEYVDTVYLRDILLPAVLGVHWEKLPTVRKPVEPYTKEFKKDIRSEYWDNRDWDNWEGFGYGYGANYGLDDDPNDFNAKKSNVVQGPGTAGFQHWANKPITDLNTQNHIRVWIHANMDLAVQLVYYAMQNPIIKLMAEMAKKKPKEKVTYFQADMSVYSKLVSDIAKLMDEVFSCIESNKEHLQNEDLDEMYEAWEAYCVVHELLFDDEEKDGKVFLVAFIKKSLEPLCSTLYDILQYGLGTKAPAAMELVHEIDKFIADLGYDYEKSAITFLEYYANNKS